MTSTAAPSTASVVRVSTLELFFDLVFVFTITQVAHLVVHAHGAVDLFRAFLVLSMTWWMYGGYAWLTNNIGTSLLAHRLLMLGGMAGFLVMALSVPESFGRDGVAFGLAYLLVTLIHVVLFARAPNPASASAILTIAPFNITAALLVLAAGYLGGQWNLVPWLGAVIIVAATSLARQARGFMLHPQHFVERHGLVMIVALGESVVSIGVGASGIPVRLPLVAAAVLGFALTAMLWWSYFDQDDARAEHAMQRASGDERMRMAMYGYGHAHLVMIAGVVLASAGVKGIVAQVTEQVNALSALFLAGGIALYLLGTVIFRRVSQIGPVRTRLIVAVLALATAAVGVAAGGLLQLALLLALLGGMLAAERRMRQDSV